MHTAPNFYDTTVADFASAAVRDLDWDPIDLVSDVVHFDSFLQDHSGPVGRCERLLCHDVEEVVVALQRRTS